MSKRLISLLLALIMVLSLCMTSCGSSEEESTGESEPEAQRRNLALTIYAITDGTTTEEGLKLVEEKISNYCVAKYKTAIDLRFYTKSEYQKALNEMYEKFAAEEKAAEEAKKLAAEEAKKEAAYKATLSIEERRKYEQQKRLEKMKAEEEAKKKAEEEAELIEQGKDVATIKEVQMDILYIPGMNDYYSYVEDGLLIDLKSYLTGKFKNIKDFVFPSFITAATLSSGIFGIPNNAGISTNQTYFIVDTALATKYAIDWTQVRSITDLNSVFAQVKASETGYTTITGDFTPEGISYYNVNGIDLAKAAGVYHDNLLGGKLTAKIGEELDKDQGTYSTLSTAGTYSTAFIDYCKTKALYRTSGYFDTTGNDKFFLSVQELTSAEKKEWEEKGYTVVLYRGADFNTEAALENGLFGISKYCAEPERAMEIIQLLSTDTEFRNLFAFGVEEVNYIKTAGDNDNKITIIDKSYSMDFFQSGNALIGYIPDTMDEDYIEFSKEKNLNSCTNPYLGFAFDWTDAKEAQYVNVFKEWEAGIKDRMALLHYGTADYETVLREVYSELYNGTGYSVSYKTWQDSSKFRDTYKTHVSKIVDLDNAIHITVPTITPTQPTGSK